MAIKSAPHSTRVSIEETHDGKIFPTNSASFVVN